MSQIHPLYQPTPPARRAAEAEAIYQLLRVLVDESKQARLEAGERLNGKVYVDGVERRDGELELMMPDGNWHRVTRIIQ